MQVYFLAIPSSVTGERFYEKLGLNRVAEGNNIIVLYPQAAPPGNFNWWGNGDANFCKYMNVNQTVLQLYTHVT